MNYLPRPPRSSLERYVLLERVVATRRGNCQWKKAKRERLSLPAVTFAYVRGLNSQRIFKLLKPLVFLYRAPSSSSSSSFSFSSFLRRSLSTVCYPFFAFSFLFAHFVRQTPARTGRETSVQSTEMKRRGRGSSGINASVRLVLQEKSKRPEALPLPLFRFTGAAKYRGPIRRRVKRQAPQQQYSGYSRPPFATVARPRDSPPIVIKRSRALLPRMESPMFSHISSRLLAPTISNEIYEKKFFVAQQTIRARPEMCIFNW